MLFMKKKDCLKIAKTHGTTVIRGSRYNFQLIQLILEKTQTTDLFAKKKPKIIKRCKISFYLGELVEYMVTSISPVAEDCSQTIRRHPEAVTMMQYIRKQKNVLQKNKTKEQISSSVVLN